MVVSLPRFQPIGEFFRSSSSLVCYPLCAFICTRIPSPELQFKKKMLQSRPLSTLYSEQLRHNISLCSPFLNYAYAPVLGIGSETGMFLGLPDPDPLVRGTDPDPSFFS
jgi:hypothetical protein